MTTLYGIKNCDTIKKARQWLSENNIEYIFHDYREDGLDRSWLEITEHRLGWDQILNKRGTTFRQLPDDKKRILDKDKAIALMLENPAMIKRPILIHQDQYFLGFKEAQYAGIFS